MREAGSGVRVPVAVGRHARYKEIREAVPVDVDGRDGRLGDAMDLVGQGRRTEVPLPLETGRPGIGSRGPKERSYRRERGEALDGLLPHVAARSGWPPAKLRDLLPDRMLASHPELYVGDPDALPIPAVTRALAR